MTRTKKSAPTAARTAAQARGRSTTAKETGPSPTTTEGLDGAMRALALALDKKALEPIMLDVRQLCSFTNYQLLISGRSDRQVDAIAESIATGLKAEGLRPLSAEG